VDRRPGFEAACRGLDKFFRHAKDQYQPRLPPLKQMAAASGVSHSAMSEAVARLRANGVIDVSRRRGIVLTSARPAVTVTPPRQGIGSRWQRLAARLRLDIGDGVYGVQALPSQKQLSGRYRVSQRTMAKALRSVVDEGALERVGRGVRRATPRRARGTTIVLFARGLPTGELLGTTVSRFVLQFSALEQACLSRNVHLQVLPCHVQPDESMTVEGWEKGSLAGAFRLDHVAGFMVWQSALHPSFVSELVRRLRRHGKPLALFCYDHSALAVDGLRLDNRVRQYAVTSDFEAGAAVGRFLMSRGHRLVEYWSDHDATWWAEERLRGLSHAFAVAGLPDGISRHTAVRGEGPGWPADPNAADEYLLKAAEAALKHFGVPYRAERIEDAAMALRDRHLYRESVYHALLPAMRRWLSGRKATAWVGANDPLALECLGFLRESGVQVARELSIVGFDDTLEAGAQGLSSYNFGDVAAVNRMVEFLLWPTAPLAKAEPGRPVEVQGFVHQRATTS
jgi:DNA-binding LacI/PurR family transcriptional regulator